MKKESFKELLRSNDNENRARNSLTDPHISQNQVYFYDEEIIAAESKSK